MHQDTVMSPHACTLVHRPRIWGLCRGHCSPFACKLEHGCCVTGLPRDMHSMDLLAEPMAMASHAQAPMQPSSPMITPCNRRQWQPRRNATCWVACVALTDFELHLAKVCEDFLTALYLAVAVYIADAEANAYCVCSGVVWSRTGKG